MNISDRKLPFAIIPNCETRAMEGIIGPLGKRGIPIVGLSSNPKCVAFSSRFLSHKLVSPDPKDENRFIEFLTRKVPTGVLFTSSDQTAVLFAKNAERLQQCGFHLNLPQLEKLVTGFDKWQCYLRVSELGIPSAKTLLITSEEEALVAAEQLGYPLIIKATRLAGGNYIRVNAAKEIVPAFRKMNTLIQSKDNLIMGASLIAQQWLEYAVEDIWCVEAYYDTKGVGRGFWPIRKWRTVIYKDGTYGSRLYSGESLKNDNLSALSKKLLDGLDWRGFAHLDWVFLASEGKFYLTEVNPRLPGFSFFPSHAGFEMAYFYYADMIDENFKVLPLVSTVYLEVFRNPGDFTSTLIACTRGQYLFKDLLSSYIRAFFGTRPLVIDYFEMFEPKRMGLNLIFVALSFFKDLIFLLSRRSK